jgi:hypothetical protein
MFFSRSRARFSAKTPAQRAAASGPALADVAADESDYRAFYGGEDAFSCVTFSFDGSLADLSNAPPKGYAAGDPVPDGILDDRAFSRGFFAAPFDFQLNDGGQIVARGLSPDITIRELSARLLAAVSEMRDGSGMWNANGSLNVKSEQALAMAADFKEVRLHALPSPLSPSAIFSHPPPLCHPPHSPITWKGFGWPEDPADLCFDDYYWGGRNGVQGYHISQDARHISVSGWDS